MKKNPVITTVALIAVCQLTSIGAFAQTQQDSLPYTQETYSSPYEALENWSPLNIDEMWDVPIVPLNLEFDFPCFGELATPGQIRLTDIGAGIEIFGDNGDFHLLSASTISISDILNVEATDSLVAAGSTHRYETSGTAPNRIFKLEFNNVGFDYEMAMTGLALSKAHFQIWLYEGGSIEYHYGPNTVSDLDAIDYWPKQSSGISSYWDFEEYMAYFMWSSGDSDDPAYPLFFNVEYDSLNISPAFDGWDAWPSNGVVYKYSYNFENTCVEDIVIDGFINVDDILAILIEFGCFFGCEFDLNSDGAVTVTDVLMILAVFGSPCPT